MAGRFAVECMIPYDEGDISTHEVVQNLNSAGRVVYNPDPTRGGRRLVFFETFEQQQEALSFNPIGEVVYRVPPDVQDDEDQEMQVAAIDRRLLQFGLVTQEQVDEINGVVPEPEEKNVSPAAAKLAAEHGLDPQVVEGTGKNGTVTKGDIERVVAQIQAQAGE